MRLPQTLIVPLVFLSAALSISAQCGAGLLPCGPACYTQGQYHCVDGQLEQGPSSDSPVQPISDNPVQPSSDTPSSLPTQSADLRVINSCSTTLWIEARYGSAGAPLPGQSSTATQVNPGSYVDYSIPETGLPGSRFWGKYGCDGQGRNCVIGDQMQYWPNPPGGCPTNGCTPPIDSLFEATWGCKPGQECNGANPTTWFDTSQVDGWTIPYKLTPNGDTSTCDCSGNGCGFSGVDASRLDLSRCPSGEDLSCNNQFPSVDVNGQTVSLESVDLRYIVNNQVVGCMSPCKKLNYGLPAGFGQSESSGATEWMCCPTPNPDNCQLSDGCVTSQECRSGPVVNTQYVADVHQMAPGVYSYSYDDGMGLHACAAGVVTYTMEFCPSGSSAYPHNL